MQLSTGVTIVEAAPGEQVLRLALPPGPYLVRTFRDGRVLSTEVQVKANEATRVEEASLTLTRDFAVMPTVFRNVEWAAHTAFTWEPTVLDNGASEMRGAISIGAGAIGLTEGTTSDAATALRSAAPSAVLSAELVWMLAGTEKIGGLGVRLGLTEQLGFTSLGPVHLLTLELAITGTAGASR